MTDHTVAATTPSTQFLPGSDRQTIPPVEQILPEFEPRMRSLCHQLLYCPQDIEDALQETAIQYMLHANSIREPDAVLAWLMTTTRNACYKILNRRKPKLAKQNKPFQNRTQEPDTDIIVKESKSSLQNELNKLPHHYQAALQLRYLDGLSHDQAAAGMNLTGNQYRGILQRAKIALRDALRPKHQDLMWQ